ncbi:MAG: hypothetical protein QW327_06760 [Candidatus Odinarchaeota archaeon]
MRFKKDGENISVISPLEWCHLIEPKPEGFQIQPNGIDLRANKIYKLLVKNGEKLFFSKNNRKGCSLQLYEPVYDSELNGLFWHLEGNATYIIEYLEKVRIPADAMGLFFQRSTLWRLYGAVITTSVWDSGYEGVGRGLLKTALAFSLEHCTPIGQLVLFKAKAAEKYKGVYQGEGLNKP